MVFQLISRFLIFLLILKIKYIFIYICHNYRKNQRSKVMKRYNANISNELIRNRKSADGISKNLLSMTELRIVLTLISLIKSNTKSFTTHEISTTDFCRFWNVSHGGKQVQALSDAVEKLKSETFRISDKTVKWLSSDSHISNGIICVTLDESLSEFLLDLSGDFTEIDLNNLLYLKSKYSIYMYLFLKSLENQKFYNIRLCEAYQKFGDNKYCNKSQFDKNIIKTAIDEINEKTDITVSCRYKKDFGYPEMLTFRICSKIESTENIISSSKHILDIQVDDEPPVFNPIISSDFKYNESNLPF